MQFVIRLGVPEMEALWADLAKGRKSGTLTAEEDELAEKLGKAAEQLANNPRHPGLASHEISDLTKKYGAPVFQSYLENRTPAAGRLYWVYGPEKGEITLIGIEPHPEYKKRKAYDRIKLSKLPPKRRKRKQ